MRDLAWKLRVWAWRLGLPIALVCCLGGCELRRIKRDCLAEIAAATTDEQVNTIERLCNLRIERR